MDKRGKGLLTSISHESCQTITMKLETIICLKVQNCSLDETIFNLTKLSKLYVELKVPTKGKIF